MTPRLLGRPFVLDDLSFAMGWCFRSYSDAIVFLFKSNKNGLNNKKTGATPVSPSFIVCCGPRISGYIRT
ncbi:MAG: hypothetical protein WBG37_17090, partial [Desulfobacterales bacterium]